ncbi:hypothetical protein E2I00_014306, partial [Balaenoptera physalus]
YHDPVLYLVSHLILLILDNSPSPRPLRPGVTLPPGALTMNTKDTTEVAENSHHLKIFLPKKLLECLPRCALLPPERLRWNTNEEIASYLITFEKHDEWLSCAPKTRPQNGSIILYNRKKVKYRKDGYLWKKRKDGKTTREDHMKLKVQGMECLYGCYVHSSIVPTFHRRCYWLLQDCGKGCSPIFCSISSDRREWLRWSREELLGQLKPMFHGIKWSCGNGTEEFSVEQLVQQILDTHPTKPAPRTHACLCSGGLELPKAHTSPSSSSSSSSSSGFAEPLEIRPSPPTSRGGSSTGGTAILLLTGLEQGTGGLTPTRHLASQADPRPSMSLAVVVGSEPSAPPAPPSPAFDPDRFLNSPQRGQTYGGGQGVSPDFPETEAAHTPCPALEPAAALEPQAAARGPPPQPRAGGRRGNCFFIQDDDSGEELKAPGAAPPVPSPPPSPAPSPSPLEPSGRVERGEALFGGAGGASELEPFSLSSFPDLMGELISDEAPSGPAPAPQLSPALSTITDFSPEWSYPEGGVKVLITGPWTEAAEHYSCVFDHIAVPASLVQPGVLRCYCPAHEVGLVSLQVAGREGPLSASVLFEYRARRFLSLPSTQLDWLSLDDNQFRMSILERLEQMEKRMAEIAAAGQAPYQGPDAPPIQDEGQGPGFEARVVVLVESMIPRSTWRGPERCWVPECTWAMGNGNGSSKGRSSEGYREGMWACALGHLEAAVLLFRWNRQALSIPDSLGRLPLSVAHSRGHVRLARCLEELQRQEASAEPPLALSPPSSSPDTEAPLLLMDYEATNPKGPPPSPPPLPPAPDGGAAPEETDSPPAVDVIPVPLMLMELRGLEVDMISLAKQIIEATPERIKREDFVGLPEAGAPMRERTGAVGLSETMSWLASYLENVDHFPSSAPPSELPFERGRLAIPPAPSWAEFLSASASGKMESDFALLTLSDHEQRELYEAARVIQTAFRKYKGRRLKEQQEVAAAVIQRCYRKYKQFALYKKMTQAAILIQSKFRSYYEQKRFQQSRRAAVLIQQHYRSYRRRPGPPHRPTGTLPARNKLLSHQEAGPGSPEDHEIPAALPAQVLPFPSLDLGLPPPPPHLPDLRVSSDSFLVSPQDEGIEAEPGAGRASPTRIGHLTSPLPFSSPWGPLLATLTTNLRAKGGDQGTLKEPTVWSIDEMRIDETITQECREMTHKPVREQSVSNMGCADEQAARLKKLQEQEKQQKVEFRKRMEKEVSDFIQDSGQIKKKFQPMNKIERSILHDVVEVAGLTSFSFGEDDECRYVMIFKKEFAPSDEELDSYRRGEEWDPQKAEEKRRLKELAQRQEEEAAQQGPVVVSPASDYKD